VTTPTAYETLAELSEVELDLVIAGDFDRVLVVQAERDAIVAELPAAPPLEARAALEHAASMQARVSAVLELQLRQIHRSES
jgi:hypothetical protein